MSVLHVYTFEDGNKGDETGTADSFTTMDYDEAKERARQYGFALVSNNYEWQDSELLEDNRPEPGDEV